MAAATTLVLKNAAAANVNYNPIRILTGQEAAYVDRTQGVLALQPKATLYFKESDVTRTVSGKVTYPVKDSITSVIDTCIGKFEMRLPMKLALADRQEVRARLAAFIADTIVNSAVDNGETPW